MKAEIREILSPDAKLDAFAPAEGEPFDVFLQILAGPVGGQELESFDLVVCNLEWLVNS